MTKRQLLYLPEINPDTFLFFYRTKRSEKSYSLREYKANGELFVTRGNSLPYSADEILLAAKYSFDTLKHPTDDTNFWYEEISKYNKKYLHSEITARNINRSEKLKDEFSIRSKEGVKIRSVEKWLQHAPPKMGIKHWKDGRSAKELARAWILTGKPKLPDALKKLLETHSLTRGFIPEIAIPEYITRIDNFPGEHRNHDLLVIGSSDYNRIVLSIEAKADESFGKMINQMSSFNPRTNLYKRIDLLTKSILGKTVQEDESIGELRYQLFTGVAGALIEAKNRNASIAAFVVHEFFSDNLDVVKLTENKEDLDRLCALLLEQPGYELPSDQLIEILSVPSGKFVPGDIPLLIGKIKTELR